MFKILEKWKILNLRVKYEVHHQNKVPLSSLAHLCITFSTLIFFLLKSTPFPPLKKKEQPEYLIHHYPPPPTFICWRPLKHLYAK